MVGINRAGRKGMVGELAELVRKGWQELVELVEKGLRGSLELVGKGW